MSVKKSIESKSLPMFAQPVGVDRSFKSFSQEPGIGSGIFLFAFPTVICATLLFMARPNGAQSINSGAKSVKKENNGSIAAKSTSTDRLIVMTALKPTVDPALSSTVTAADISRRPLTYYTQGVRDNMFSAPQPPAPPPPIVVKAPPAPIVPVMVINPFADWSYTGTIQMGTVMMALLENTKTKEGQYVKQGESFMGAKVSSITEQMVTLSSAGKPAMLAKSDTITTTPLDKSASNVSSQPAGTPGTPPGAQGAPNMPGMPSAGDVTLPNGNVISADRAARRARRMNRFFNGG